MRMKSIRWMIAWAGVGSLAVVLTVSGCGGGKGGGEVPKDAKKAVEGTGSKEAKEEFGKAAMPGLDPELTKDLREGLEE